MKITKSKDFPGQKLKDLYGEYLRPLNSDLLRVLRLDLKYVDGQGNWLTYEDESSGQKVKVLDAIGGYGANILGHKNSEILKCVEDNIWNLPPNNVQASLRSAATQLGMELSEMLSLETKAGPWVTTFSNSGTEAVEAALKQALIYYRNRNQRINIQFLNAINQLRIYEREFGCGAELLSSLLKEVAAKLDGTWPALLQECKSFTDFCNFLTRFNEQSLNALPYFLALEGAFHGKSFGSLAVSYNPEFKKYFYSEQLGLKTEFILRNDLNHLQEAWKKFQKIIFIPQISKSGITLTSMQYSAVAAFILEPVQGEGGIRCLQQDFVRAIKNYCGQSGTLLIFDEIQAGLFRTGKMASGSHLQVAADIYCFSKGLGGGVAKIAATSMLKEKYIAEFGYLHTSTFAEDEFSSVIGLKSLQLLKKIAMDIDGLNVTADYLKRGLEDIAKNYPHIVKEVRGKCLMLGVEFREELGEQNYEFKIFNDCGMLGYFFASALLYNEHLRIAPTLSAEKTLRIAPSLFITKEECGLIIKAIGSLVKALDRKDMKYFFSHVYPGYEILPATPLERPLSNGPKGEKNLAVFLCHMIDIFQAKVIVKSLSKVTDETFKKKLKKIAPLLEFKNYFRGYIHDKNGKEVEAILLALPTVSEILVESLKEEVEQSFLSRKHLEFVKIVQSAIDVAYELGASTVGLGGFCSILTNNGQFLDARGMNLTSGNSYTTFLTIAAALRKFNEVGRNIKQAEVVCVGAAGNIVSTCASLIADHCRSITLIYHSSIADNPKMQKALETILMDIANSAGHSPVAMVLREKLRALPNYFPETLLDFLQQEEVKSVFKVSCDMNDIKSADLVITGTNSVRPIIFSEHLKDGAIVVDVGVPFNVDQNIINTRPDIKYIRGGIALCPEYKGRRSTIDAIFNIYLKQHECYGCFAETMIMALSELKESYHIGPISKNLVVKMQKLAEQTGFTLGSDKILDSF